ncbi:MAG: hypothetical protein NC086_05005 [Alistipes sp.]|nr:hypothetical protein [Alistipes sp.]
MDYNAKECCIVNNITEILKNKEIYVFGAGTFGEDFLTLYQNQLNVVAYIDNKRAGYRVNDIDIISIKDYMKIKSSKTVIVITTEYYSLEIAKQLDLIGLIPNQDYYIWDPKSVYHLDEDTKKYIEFNKKLWSKDKHENTKRKILIPFMQSQDTGATMYAYLGNFLAEKYDAQIVAYVRGGRSRSTISDAIRQVYESFNTVDLITPELDESQETEVQRILADIWPNIHTFSDWQEINIYGLAIGTVFIQNYLRYEVICFEYTDKWYEYLKKAIKIFVFWYQWFKENDVKTVILLDSGNYDGYMRDIACHFNIPTYCVYYDCMQKLCEGYSQKCNGSQFPFYKKFWEELTEEEQIYGIEWGKKHIKDRLEGQQMNIDAGKESPFTSPKNTRLTNNTDKVKVLICPHIFEEESIHSGWQIFGDYVSWLIHLGELSEKTDYDWYIKEHPAGSNRDRMFFDDYCKKYKKIKRLPLMASPKQLQEEGIKFALTVCGTLGHEYPMLGINVINAGNNPHIAYDFDYNPTSQDEYDELILNLEKLYKDIDEEEIYKCICVHWLYYKPEGAECWKNFFIDPKLVGNKIDSGSWKYRSFMNEWSKERHEEIFENIKKIFREMDERNKEIFYRWEEII